VSAAPEVPLSRVLGALSHALDLTEGEPAGHAERSCQIGMRIAEALGLDAGTRSQLFYALLLKDAGCSANAARMSALFAVDEHVAKRTAKRVDWSRKLPAFLWSLHTVAPGGSLRSRVDRLRAIKAEGEVTKAFMLARCERGAEIAHLLGFEAPTAEAIRALDEHWDGGGQPRGLRGEEIPLLARILCLAQTAEIFHAAGGVDAMWAVARRRRGRWFDPALVDALGTTRADSAFWDGLRGGDAAAWEPEDRTIVADEDRLDRIADAFAGIVDAKSPWTYRHSDRTCVIAMSLANVAGAEPDGLRDFRRAALLHDIGKLALSNRILDKPGPLDGAEFALVREHPLVTERILAEVPGCEHLVDLAGAHHERLDGSGYPRGLAGPALSTPMRLLAVADVYEALTSDRPYRRALRSDEALGVMRGDVPARLDARAFAILGELLAGEPGVLEADRAEAVLDPHPHR
jgi:HD-GYP domain-containing protein (c-di-GMP phosphodiesterase class II)